MTRMLFRIMTCVLCLTAMPPLAHADDLYDSPAAQTDLFSDTNDCQIFSDCNKDERGLDRIVHDTSGDTEELGNGLNNGRGGNDTIGESVINLLEPASGR